MPATDVLTRDFLKSVSNSPGVYQMLSDKEVLYVGKAADLRKRLASYAGIPESKHSKTGVMLSKVCRIDTILTSTEKEALILEASLIKKHRPRYNVILRDDKNYPLIKITTRDEWPRIIVTRKRLRDGNRYFGPYASISAMRATLKLLYSMFPLRRCRKVRPRKRACLNYQLKRCLAPCIDQVSSQKYAKMVQQALLILEGRNKELLPQLEKEMLSCSKKLLFEEAAKYRDLIAGIKRTIEQQVAVSSHFRDQDVFGLARKDASIAIAVIFVRSGTISGFQPFFLDDPIGEDNRILTATILQYYSPQRPPPGEILLTKEPADIALVIERLTEIREKKVSLVTPQRGVKRKLITMANDNAAQIFAAQDKKKQSWQNLSKALRKKIKLQRDPSRIECIDISNLGGKQAVGSLVCFLDGEKNVQGYRHYRIRTKDTPDDYAMMEETLSRRLLSPNRDNKLPDLLVLDGGKGQLNIAIAIVNQAGLEDKIELVAIAKEKDGEGEKLFRPGRKNPILLPRHDPVLLFLMRIRDESHRYGVTFHRKLRNKATLFSDLDTIPGIGIEKKKNLLKHMGSLKRIKTATIAELLEVKGIGSELAKQINSHFH